jgi:hypothetical protein
MRPKFHCNLKEATMNTTDSPGRRKFLQGSAAVIAASCCGWPAWAQDPPARHSMLIVGEQTVFLSHLPLFGAPHNYQVILEASFSKPGSDPQADYFNSRKQTKTKIYTLDPAAFVLPRLAAAEPLRSFKATLYKGNFEEMDERRREGARIGQDVDVTVNKVIHFRKFDPAAAKPAQLEYLLFGKGSELFLAHLIVKAADFDQVMSVKSVNQRFTDEELSRGVPIAIAGKANSAAKRLKDGETVTGQVKGAAGAAPKTVKLQAGVEFYTEDELE